MPAKKSAQKAAADKKPAAKATAAKNGAPKQPAAPPAPPPPKEGKLTMPGRNGGTLNRAKPGQVTNPKGRGKGTLNNSTVLKRWLTQDVIAVNPATKASEKMSVLDAMTIAMIGAALGGDTKAYKELMDRLEGKPRQRVELTGEEGGPIKQEITDSTDIDYDALDSETLRKIAAARTRRVDG